MLTHILYITVNLNHQKRQPHTSTEWRRRQTPLHRVQKTKGQPTPIKRCPVTPTHNQPHVAQRMERAATMLQRSKPPRQHNNIGQTPPTPGGANNMVEIRRTTTAINNMTPMTNIDKNPEGVHTHFDHTPEPEGTHRKPTPSNKMTRRCILPKTLCNNTYTNAHLNPPLPHHRT
jgi:hypothetical protein